MTVTSAGPTAPQRPIDLTFEDALASATRIKEQVAAEAADTEARGAHSAELHEQFLEAGFYHLLTPRMFGGYEFTLGQFMRVMREIAKGDMATAWCLTLASGHNLQVASWWPEDAQRELYGSGDYFATPMTSAPSGTLTRVEGGYRVEGVHPYASGIPFSTHFAGHARHTEDPDVVSTFIAPRSSFEVLDDWGRTLGLRGSGSNSVRFDGAVIPEHFVLRGVQQVNVDVTAGTPGVALHDNPMYGGRGVGFFGVELANLNVGAVEGALELYAQLMLTKKTVRPPVVPRVEDDRYLWWYGDATVRLTMAGDVLDAAAERYMEACRLQSAGTRAFGRADDMLIAMLGRNALAMAWDVMQGDLFHSAGSSAAVAGSRFERIFRDVSMGWGHLATLGYAWSPTEFARLAFAARTADAG